VIRRESSVSPVAGQSHEAFADELRRRFQLAARALPVRSIGVSVAAQRFTFDFVGEGLSDALTQSFADVSSGPVSAHNELVVSCWDSESTGVEPPPPPSDRLLLHGFEALGVDSLRLAFSSVTGTLLAYRRASHFASAWVRSVSALPGWYVAAPFRTFISWWAETWEGVLAHAAVVGYPKGGVLLAGASGAGKSTTALAAVASGARFLSDDCALLKMDPGAVAHIVYRTAKVDPRWLVSGLSALRGFETKLEHDRGKAILTFPRGERMLLGRCPIVAVLVQSISDSDSTRLAPVSPGRALAALAPSTLLQSPGTGQQSLDVLAEIVNSVPCFELRSGRNLEQVAARLLSLLS
jgi:hypothetical protein